MVKKKKKKISLNIELIGWWEIHVSFLPIYFLDLLCCPGSDLPQQTSEPLHHRRPARDAAEVLWFALHAQHGRSHTGWVTASPVAFSTRRTRCLQSFRQCRKVAFPTRAGSPLPYMQLKAMSHQNRQPLGVLFFYKQDGQTVLFFFVQKEFKNRSKLLQLEMFSQWN